MLDSSKCWTAHAVVAIDFETCGLLPSDGACEIACVRFEDGREVAAWSSLLNPGHDIPEGATAIHGITADMVRGAPSLVDAAPRIAELAAGAVPCAYNAPFDRAFLHATITGTDCPAFDASQAWIDPLVVVRKVDRFARGAGRHKLEETIRRWGVAMRGQAHRAEADARAAGELLYAMAANGALRPCPLGKFLASLDAERARQESEREAFHARLSAAREIVK